MDLNTPSTTPTPPTPSTTYTTYNVSNCINYGTTDLVIYHGGCPDGIAGAWCFWKYVLNKDNSKFYGGKHNENPPDVKDKNVVFVDFSYNFDVMNLLLKEAKSIRVLDHHKSSTDITKIDSLLFSYVFDMNRSGAQIAWDEVTSNAIRPWFIDDIGDRDLWKWKRMESKNTTRSMFGLGYYENFEKFDQLSLIDMDKMIMIGKILNDDDEQQYVKTCSRAIDCIAISNDPSKTWKVRIVECDHSIASEVGNRLVKDKLCDFSVMFRYNIKDDEWWLSCRSLKGQNIDLTTILKEFDSNAGGHPESAGMTLKGSNALQKHFKPVTKSFKSLEVEV